MSNPNERLVTVRDVWKTYDRGRISVLQGVSLDVESG